MNLQSLPHELFVNIAKFLPKPCDVHSLSLALPCSLSLLSSSYFYNAFLSTKTKRMFFRLEEVRIVDLGSFERFEKFVEARKRLEIVSDGRSFFAGSPHSFRHDHKCSSYCALTNLVNAGRLDFVRLYLRDTLHFFWENGYMEHSIKSKKYYLISSRMAASHLARLTIKSPLMGATLANADFLESFEGDSALEALVVAVCVEMSDAPYLWPLRSRRVNLFLVHILKKHGKDDEILERLLRRGAPCAQFFFPREISRELVCFALYSSTTAFLRRFLREQIGEENFPTFFSRRRSDVATDGSTFFCCTFRPAVCMFLLEAGFKLDPRFFEHYFRTQILSAHKVSLSEEMERIEFIDVIWDLYPRCRPSYHDLYVVCRPGVHEVSVHVLGHLIKKTDVDCTTLYEHCAYSPYLMEVLKKKINA
jgi:hypothetical protein